MAKQKVSRTALGAVICRMIEQYQPEKTRLFGALLVDEIGHIALEAENTAITENDC